MKKSTAKSIDTIASSEESIESPKSTVTPHHYTLDIVATLITPLTHGSGEDHTDRVDRKDYKTGLAMKKTILVKDEEGSRPVTLPCFNGNAWRGQLRQLVGRTLLASLRRHQKTVTPDQFRNLLSPGSMLGKKGEKDTEPFEAFYHRLPHFWLFGGTPKNSPMHGHLIVSDWMPILQETVNTRQVPASYAETAPSLRNIQEAMPMQEEWRTPLTEIQLMTRRDPRRSTANLTALSANDCQRILDEYDTEKASRTKGGPTKAITASTTAKASPVQPTRQRKKEMRKPRTT